MASRRILGIDPGTRFCGWAVLDVDSSGRPSRVASGVYKLGNSAPLLDRLTRLRTHFLESLKQYGPDLVVLESAFIGRNARSALRLGEARGVLMVTTAEAECELLEIPPALVKRRVAGSGTASKEQVAALVAAQLEIAPHFENFDESDSLAIALCAALEEQVADVHNEPARSGIPPGASPQ